MKKTFSKLESDRLLLRQFQNSDIDYVFMGLSHPDIIRYYGVNYDSLEATQEQMIWFENLETSGTGIWWAICNLADKKFLGAAGLNDLSNKDKNAELGFWLLTENWGQGIVAEAIPMIISHAFHELSLHRIEAFVETENLNSKKTLASLGFEHEGTRRDCEVKNGEFISLDVYSILNTNLDR